MKTAEILIRDIEELFENTLRLILQEGEKNSFEELSSKDKNEFIEAFEETWINYFQNKASGIYSSFLESNFKNQNIISDIHSECFQHFCGYIKLCYDLFHNLIEELDSFGSSTSNKIIIANYGDLIRISDQIFIMILNGYPDGALRLWRSLHERSVVLMLFIRECNNDEIFKRFIGHEHLRKKRKIESYMKHHEILNFPILDDDMIQNTQEVFNEYIEQYGKEFFNEYGWAESLSISKNRLTFRDIEDIVDYTKLRPYYIWASSYIHPSFESLLDYSSADKVIDLNKITEQTNDRGSIIDPLQLTLTSLHEVNLRFLKLYCLDNEYDINVKLFIKIFEMMQGTFR